MCHQRTRAPEQIARLFDLPRWCGDPPYGTDQAKWKAFVKDLKSEVPAAAAGLLARMLPPELEPDMSGDCVATVNHAICPDGNYRPFDEAGKLCIEHNAQHPRGPQLLEHDSAPLELDPTVEIEQPIESAPARAPGAFGAEIVELRRHRPDDD